MKIEDYALIGDCQGAAMNPISIYTLSVLLLFSASIAIAAADDLTVYNERASTRVAVLFQSLDRNADGVVTREESHGDLDFGPRFADMDVNGDGRVTKPSCSATFNTLRREPAGRESEIAGWCAARRNGIL
ncbi:MAG: hypothetical protein ACT4PS_10580 [Betaproteobacteria bacterium]